MASVRELAMAGKPQEVPIIDAHCHIGRYRNIAWYQAYDSTPDVISHMDDLGIRCAVTAPHTLIIGDMEMTNAAAAAAAEAYSGRIYCYISIVPTAGIAEVRSQIAKYAKNPSFVGLKMLPGYHGSLLQDEYSYAYDFADEARCPVLTHKFGEDPAASELRRHLERRPRLKLLVAHQGGGYAERTDEVAPILLDYEFAKMELCGSMTNTYTVEDLVGIIGEDRLVYGSDLINVELKYDFGRVAFSPIGDGVKRRVFAGNYLSMLEGSQMGGIAVN